jgi:hypothetical protein
LATENVDGFFPVGLAYMSKSEYSNRKINLYSKLSCECSSM